MTRTGPAIADNEPLVSTLGRGACLLGIEPDVLAAAVASAGLVPWGEHADGSPVYGWAGLLEVVQAAGLPIPTRKGHRWRVRPTIVRSVKT
jgi:hypothetical protein